MIRVFHVGLGPIGSMVAQQIASHAGFRIVGAVDIDPKSAGRDLGEVIDLGRPLRVRVTGDIGRTIRATRPDVAVMCTGSSLEAVLPQFEEVLRRRVAIVTTTEEAAYPAPPSASASIVSRCTASRTRASGGCRFNERSAPGSRVRSSSGRWKAAPSVTSASRNPST